MKIPKIAIVGRTNVGKSTLFNALTGRRLSIVKDVHGVTRDRRYTEINKQGFQFVLIDTGGIVGEEETAMQDLVRQQAEIAINEADLVWVVFDGVEGPTPLDKEVVDILRRAQKPVMWVINKCEKTSTREASGEFYSLGLDELHFIAAVHREGLRELVKATQKKIGEIDWSGTKAEKEDHEKKLIRVAVVGRPNVGKSSLINRIIGEERLVTSPIAGTTRDSIDIDVTREGQQFRFVDTAGLRKKARVDDQTVERYANLRTLRALAQCDVAVLVLDATLGTPSAQDTKVAGLAHERGKGLIIVVNKWDAIEKDHKSVKTYRDVVEEAFKFAKYAPVIFVSALTGRRCPSVLETVRDVFIASHGRVQTSDLNKVLSRAIERKPPPVYRGQPLKFFFATQVSTAPPEFVLFFNHPRKVHFAYERYLKNVLRDNFPFPGSDIKMKLRKTRKEEEEAK